MGRKFKVYLDSGANCQSRYEVEVGLDDWIQWHGGECPVDSDAIVEVKYRKPSPYEFNNDRARYFDWSHDGFGGDIIAYRLQQHGIDSRANDDRLGQDLNECIGQEVAPAWNGTGLPPVGSRVEYTCKQPDIGHPAIEVGRWYGGTIIAYYNECVWTSDNGIRHLSNTVFRPMRSESDNKRYASIEALFDVLDAGVSTSQDAVDVYEAIASGKIPGIKLEEK